MKIALFGATGGTGRIVLEQALEAGHAVTALARDPDKIDGSHPNLATIAGDARDAEAVLKTIAGTDAVVSTLGPARGGPMDVMSRAAENIVAAMKQHGVKRLVFSTGAGVPAPEDRSTGMSRVMGFLLRTLARAVYEDSIRAAEIVKGSGLDWTILRGPMLKGAPYDGNYQFGFVGAGMNPSVSRGNFAHGALRLLETGDYRHRMPAVSDR